MVMAHTSDYANYISSLYTDIQHTLHLPNPRSLNLRPVSLRPKNTTVYAIYTYINKLYIFIYISLNTHMATRTFWLISLRVADCICSYKWQVSDGKCVHWVGLSQHSVTARRCGANVDKLIRIKCHRIMAHDVVSCCTQSNHEDIQYDVYCSLASCDFHMLTLKLTST